MGDLFDRSDLKLIKTTSDFRSALAVTDATPFSQLTVSQRFI